MAKPASPVAAGCYYTERRRRMQRQKMRRIPSLIAPMKMVMLLLVSMPCCPVECNRTVQMAVLLPYKGLWTAGFGISGAVPLAVNYVRTDPSFAYMRSQGYDLNYTILNCPCDQGPGLAVFAKAYASVNPVYDVFIGPGCDPVCEPASKITEAEDLLMISYGCVSPMLSSIETSIRTVSTYTEIGPLIHSFCKRYGWTRVGILIAADNVWQTTSVYLKNYLSAADNMEVYTYQFYEVAVHVDQQSQLLERISIMEQAKSENRVFILLSYNYALMDLIYIAQLLNMLSGDYAFIASTLTLDNVFWNEAYSSYGLTSDLINGWFYFTLLYPDGDAANKFISNVASLAIPLPGINSPGEKVPDSQVDPHVFPLYDAIVLYATGVNNSISNYTNIDSGSNVSDYMRNVYFEGFGGRTYEDEYGDAVPRFSISNVRYGAFLQIAQYSDKNVVFRDVPVQWPGGGFSPVLGRPACGWHNQYCSQNNLVQMKVENNDVIECMMLSLLAVTIIVSTVISGTAVIALIAAIIITYKYKQARSHLASLAWKISYSELNFEVNNSSKSFESARHSMRLAASSEGALASADSLAEIEDAPGRGSWTSSVLPAYYNGQLVAVKHIQKPFVATTPNIVVEVNLVRLLRHQNIVPLIGACLEPNHICVVIGYCSKGSLRDVLQSRHITTDKIFTTSFAGDIVQGMTYLHNTPVKYHGNLKSSNVLIDSRWSCKISDFGLHEFRMGEGGPSRGDPAYYYAQLWTAPELLRQDDYARTGSQKGDVYSFGIILQEIVTRKSPFGYGYTKPKEIVDRVRKAEFPPFRPRVTVEEAGTADLLELMMACWDEDMTVRPSFDVIKETLKKMSRGRQTNLVDQMIYMLEKHSAHLEELVQERTKQLTEEQKKTEELLSRMLPKSVAEALKKGEMVDPENYASVTVSFSDIVGFTAMAASSNPLQIVTFLNDLYTCFDTTIEKFDAYKVETIGDAYMVASGVPVRNGNRHAGEIAMLALELLSEIRTFRIRHLPDKQLQLRLGVHSGPVVAGVVGVKMPRYCLFGDTVNTASRMESSGLALRVHVSPDTKLLLDGLGGFHLSERGPIAMKGKGTITTYFLVRRDGFDKKLPDISLAAPISEHEFK